jgi:formate dehydrogenase beta subunit
MPACSLLCICAGPFSRVTQAAMIKHPSDLVVPPDLSHGHAMYSTRKRRPVYVDLLPPCNHACPAGENIQAWLALAQAGEFEAAFQRLVQDNPFPAIHGRVCYHPCESACNRGELDQSVSVHAVERFLGDQARELGWTIRVDAAASGKRVLVVGAGPSGLSAAYHLARLGHSVEIHDAGAVAGGMMTAGIPAYRLPRPVLAAEIERIERMGVRIVLNHKISDVLAAQREGEFDAVFLAIGAQLGKRTEIPARDAGTIYDALSFLAASARGAPPKLGRRVAVYGGGNTAMDVARVAKRLGHDPLIIYRRDLEHMPAQRFEAEEALEEGVKFHWLRSISAIEQGSMEIEIMELDAKGRPHGTGKLQRLEADSLILALGQDTDTSFLRPIPGLEFDRDGTLKVGAEFMTGHPGIFAGGDMVPSERTVTIAVGHGKRAARHIAAYLAGQALPPRPERTPVGFSALHVWYYTDAERHEQSHLALERRVQSFDEVVGGLSEPDARHEAQRCLSCGNCYECDGCFGACPSQAVIKLGKGNRYRFDYDRCTGCAVCFEQCPCHAIELTTSSAEQQT